MLNRGKTATGTSTKHRFVTWHITILNYLKPHKFKRIFKYLARNSQSSTVSGHKQRRNCYPAWFIAENPERDVRHDSSPVARHSIGTTGPTVLNAI
jgi:hypothetical protein